VAAGTMTADQAETLTRVLIGHVKIAEVAELEARLYAIERRAKGLRVA
jgi:hypothetical protein